MARRAPETLIAAALAIVLALTACGSDDATATSDTPSETTKGPSEAVSEEPTEALPAETTEPGVEPTIDPEDPGDPDDPTEEIDDDLAELDGLDVELCDSPTREEYYVDVALDDPDGGLNMRTAPGVEHDIVGVFPRSDGLRPTGACATLDTVDWWKMTSGDGVVEGWVSSRYLSEFLVFNPGVGKAIDDLDNIGATAPTLEELAADIAESYGFDGDVMITMTSDAPAIDAQGGSATFEMTGLKDDASNGYIVDIDFTFDKDAEGEIDGVTATKVTNYSLCTRGVTEDGLCT